MGGKREFELILEIGHKSQPLTKKMSNGYTHKWTVFVKGFENSKIENCIQRVLFKLHESFDNPHRDITEPPFAIKETGYAGFDIDITIFFKNKEEPNQLHFAHDLKLLTNKPNNKSTIEKIKFINPNRDFEKCLIKSGAQVNTVPVMKKKRSDSPPAKKQKSSSLIPSKDMNKQLLSQPPNQPQSQQQSQSHHAPQSQQTHQPHHHSSHHHKTTSHHNQHNQSGSNSSNGGSGITANHQQPKRQAHPSHSVTKPKVSSKQFIDVFGAPLVFNNNHKPTNNGSGGSGGSGSSSNTSSNNSHHSANHVTQSITNLGNNTANDSNSLSRSISTSVNNSHSHNNNLVNVTHSHSRHKESVKEKEKKDINNRNNNVSVKEEPFVDELQLIQAKISSISDGDLLQKIVDIIEETGEWYNLTSRKFEFDLKRLDKKTLSRIERCLH